MGARARGMAAELASRPSSRVVARSARMRVAAAAAAVIFLLAAGPLDAAAHARLVASKPRDRELFAASPKAVELSFNELLDDDFNSIDVFADVAPGGDRPNLAAAPAVVDPKDRTRLTVSLKALPPGGYVVHWKVLSRDGHTARGRIPFRVLPDRDGGY